MQLGLLEIVSQLPSRGYSEHQIYWLVNNDLSPLKDGYILYVHIVQEKSY